MADELLISKGDIVQLSEVTPEIDALISEINRIEQAILAVKKNPINAGSILGMKELREAATQLNQSIKELNGTISVLSRSTSGKAFQDSAQAAKTNSQAVNENSAAYQKLQNETKQAEVNAKNLAVEFGADSEKALAAAQAYEVLRQKLDQVNAVTKKKTAPTVATSEVPYSTNVNQINEENSRSINATGEAVSELEKEQAQAANTATAWGNAQLLATEEAENEAKVIPEIVGALDEYTGSISQNVKAQLENNAALVANRAEQKLILADLKTVGSLTDAQTVKLSQLKTEELSLVETNRNLTATIKNQVKEFTTEEGSIDNLRAKVNLLQRSYEGLSASEKRSQFGIDIKKQIDQLEPSLKASEGEIGKFQRNVGNYTGGITKVFGNAFSYLRQLAYILPGVGIAGILGAVSEAVIDLTKNIFESSSSMNVANGETKQMIELQKELLSAVSSTTDAFISYENTVSKSNSAVLDKLKGELSVLEASGVNVEKTFALKKRIAELEQQGAGAEQDINIRLATKERADLIAGLKTEIELLDRRNIGFNKSSSASKRIEELEKELKTLDVVVTKENAVELSREFHRKNILDLDNQIIAGNNKLGELIATGAGKKDIERQKEYISNLQQREQIENKVYGELTNSQQKYVQTSIALDQLQTEEAKFNADERRKYELESQRLLVEEKRTLSHSIISDTRSTLEEQLNSIKVLNDEQEKLIQKEKANVINNPGSSRVDRVLAEKKAAEQLYALTIQTEDQKFQIQEKYRLKNIEAEKQIFTQEKQLHIDQIREFANNTEFNQDERLAFQQEIFDSQKAIIDKEHEAKLKSVENTFLTDEEKAAIETDYNDKIIKLYRNTQNEIYNIQKSAIDRLQELKQEDVERTKDIFSDISSSAASRYAQDIEDLNNSLKGREISYDRYLKNRKKLDQDYHADALKTTINEIEAELNAYNGAEAQFSAAQLNLNQLREKLTKTTNPDDQQRIAGEITVAEKTYEVTKENVDKKKKLLKDLNQADKDLSDDSTNNDIDNQKRRVEVAQEALGKTLDFIAQLKDLGDTLSDSRIQQYEAEKDALENRYQAEIDLINQAYTNAVDRDRALTEAKKRNAAAKKQIDDKEKDENIKKARFDKQAAIFSIILNTAKAIVEDLGKPWKIAFDAAIGAAELAVAVAQPLPKYFKGKNVDRFTQDDYEGQAIVNDGGKKEAIIRKNGDVKLPQKWNSVEWVGKDDIVLPDANVLAWKATRSAAETPIVYVTTTHSGLSREDYMYGVNKLDRSIKNNQQRQRPSDMNREMMKAWIRSSRNFKDFFN